ncbi:MAG: DUF502 domain-containing protein [Desulfomonilaceae bacterium]|nr:DUF502 domain-containing protein [Desulfomonilaceae bacterium]
MRTFFSTILRLFLTGVATLLPFIVTVFVIGWVVRLADAYIGPSSTFGLFIVAIVGESQRYVGYGAGYLVVVVLTIFLGFLVTRATVARVHAAIDRMFARIPLFGKVYTAVGQVVDLFGKKNNSGLEKFGGVGFVRLGNIKALGLLTSGERYVLGNGREHLLVFVPNSPIPATGFAMLVPVEDFETVDMPIEDLAKLLMSLGLLGPQVLKDPYGADRIVKRTHGTEVIRESLAKVSR